MLHQAEGGRYYPAASTHGDIHGIRPHIRKDLIGGKIVLGSVVARNISYSIDGLEAELTVAPGVENMDVNVGEADIESYTGDFGTEEY